MKISWVLWWIVLLIKTIEFGILSMMVWTRKVDAAGVEQTVQLKLINIAVLGIFMLLPCLLVQLIWMIFNFIYSKKKNRKINYQ